MKTINKYLYTLLILSSVLLVSCADLDLVPEGDKFTEQQKEDLLNKSPERLQAEVNGLYSGLFKFDTMTDFSTSTYHYDFGYAAAMMMFDASGQDVPAENAGYNWFRNSLRYLDRTSKHDVTYFLWNLFYSHMKTANDILASVDPETEEAVLKSYRGQALASRAFDYLNLVQIYQFTYKGHESALAVPIVTEATTPDEAANNPRATVQDVYDLIISDLTQAIELLDGFARPGKEFINQNVAYGLRARAYLNMEEWEEAAADAEKAMTGYTPYSLTAVSKPSFNNISASSWIWGTDVSETNDVVSTGIINFPSHMCSFTGNGYAPGYTGRYINSNLWNVIPESDVRKGWWTEAVWGKDEQGNDVIVNYKTPLADMSWTITVDGKTYGIIDWFGWNDPYLNVKFGPYKDEYNNPTNASDLPIMRAEEMILIRAEALAMGGDVAGGKRVLEDFVKEYRNPGFVSQASDAQGVQDEVWFQRRIELWGEGFSLFDVKRLKKPIERRGTNFPEATRYDLPAEAPILLWVIPEKEENTNEGIDVNTNNPIITPPEV